MIPRSRTRRLGRVERVAVADSHSQRSEERSYASALFNKETLLTEAREWGARSPKKAGMASTWVSNSHV